MIVVISEADKRSEYYGEDRRCAKEGLLYAFWRVCGIVNLHRDMLNARYQNTEPAVLIVTTALVTYVGQRALRRLIYGEGFVPNVRRGVLASLRKLPIVRDYVHEHMDKIAGGLWSGLSTSATPIASSSSNCPDKGWTPEAILEGMAQNDSLSHVDWKKGVVSGAIYTEHDPKLEGLMISVYERHLRSNPLHSDVFVGVRKMESEVIRWCCKLFHGGPDSCGSMTSGGTESLILACKAHRDYGYFEKGIVYPEMVVPATAHAGFDKLGVKYGIPVHVDACLGGFLVPFMDDAGFPLPPFDFRLEGVISISADTHKYGYTPKGSSMVMYRSQKYHHYQFSVATDWPGGVYATPTLSGSRAGSVAACTWASLLYYGREGYVEATRKIITTTRKIVEELRSVPGIKVLGSPDVSVVAVGSDEFDVFQLMDKLTSRGWNLNPLQYPSGFHLCVTLLHVAEKVADRFSQ
ncbi:hypothetical protein HPB50_009984 [Hyalomma asiaticum]|uniref:Uncharacterized protein n=1 Tax=Hyalomma asiaticum TaxID=266040 RepID=A0ACB7TI46_HYAAI|nr:hypothetical protein HPB50_009984 [Hyalomma asiaticum]